MDAIVEKPTARLNARTIATLKSTGRRRDLFDTGRGAVRGLTLRITASGHKSWTLIYRIDGTKKRWTIGSADTIGLAAARKKANRALRALDEDGIDPSTQKKIQRDAPTFADLDDEFKIAKKAKRSWPEDERMLRKILLPAWRHKKLAEITRHDVKLLLNKIVAAGHPVMANRVHALISTMFNYGIQEELVGANPAARITKQQETSRDRVLTADEIRELWNACNDAKRVRRADEQPAAINPMIARTLQGVLLTGQRPGEVAKMRRQDVDMQSQWWTIPVIHAKNREAHRVPLCQRAIDLIEEAIQHGPDNNLWVFAGLKGGSVAARSVKAVKALRDAGAIDVADIRRHDLRRTVASGMAEAGVAPTVISRVLNHVDRGARATHVYIRYNFDREKLDAIARWEQALNRILAASEPARVVNFPR